MSARIANLCCLVALLSGAKLVCLMFLPNKACTRQGWAGVQGSDPAIIPVNYDGLHSIPTLAGNANHSASAALPQKAGGLHPPNGQSDPHSARLTARKEDMYLRITDDGTKVAPGVYLISKLHMASLIDYLAEVVGLQIADAEHCVQRNSSIQAACPLCGRDPEHHDMYCDNHPHNAKTPLS